MPLLSLPDELLLCLSENLESEKDIYAFAQASQRLYCVLNSLMYRYNIQNSKGSALLWASRRGQETTVWKFLGADVDMQGRTYGSALRAASFEGHEAIVRLLLEKGADVNAQGGNFDNALQAASYRGHEAIVMLLLKKDADVNAQGGKFGSAFQAASHRGHEAIMRLLLEKGAC